MTAKVSDVPLPAEAAGRADWKGTARYEVVRRIGQGGMGAVYEARDRERRQRVALKTLLQFDPAALYRFKQEFRTLADVHHPNLVRLHELVATDSDHVFFAMELIRGTDFLTFVRKKSSPADRGDEPPPSAMEETMVDQHSSVPRAAAISSAPPDRAGAAKAGTPPRRRPCQADLDRLRPALRQLVEGVHALHAAGKMHRDIKPPNILVTAEGRVVLLDFGVATELPRVADRSVQKEGEVVGTVRYMAPEQAFADTTASSDWYAVGVVVFEALVGRPPFAGTSFEVIEMKLTAEPPAPSECVEGVPDDLDQLCKALLDRIPERRPTGAEILQRIGGAQSAQRPTRTDAVGGVPNLIGRETHLRSLLEAFETTRAGTSMTVWVSGLAGMGKSALVQHFLDGLVERREVVVLRGRAYERETVPYKAVDSVIDALTRHLLYLGDKEETLALPRDIWALAHLFPVLQRVPGIAQATPEPITDPNRVRRRAFAAFRELLSTVAQRGPLVLFVDDAQWGDTDSTALFAEVMRPPHAPPILLVLAHREEDARTAPFLTELRNRWPSGAKAQTMTVGPLEVEEAQRLSLALLGAQSPSARKMAEAVARESSGSPFLVEELSRSATGRLLADSEAHIKLDEVMAERLESLPPDARRLVEIVAIGGRPLPVSCVGDAAEVTSTEDVIAVLSNRHFVRPGLRDGREIVEIVHDRIRETIVAHLPALLVRQHHGGLARVLEATPGADPETVAVHLFGAGETERGASFAERAAEQAARQLAFDQAARLFAMTIDTLPASSPKVRGLRIRMGEALGWAGRVAEAGHALLAAADGAPSLEQLGLQRAASEQLIAAGRIEEGGLVLRRVLAGAGVKVPRSPLSAIAWLVLYTLWLNLRSLRFRERRPDEVPPTDRLRIDAIHVAALGLTSVDQIMASCMQARQLAVALRLGDPTVVLRAAALFGNCLAIRGGPIDRHERRIRDLIGRLAERNRSAPEAALSQAMLGAALFLRGRWKESLNVFDGAYANLPNQRAGWQTQAALYATYDLVFLGDFVEMRRRYERLLTEAEQRGALFLSVLLRTGPTSILWLAADDPGSAREQAGLAASRTSLWSDGKYLLQHWQLMRTESEIELYAGEGSAAYERLERDARALDKSMLLRVQFMRALTSFLRGRAAIASIDTVPEKRTERVAEARRMSRKLEREDMSWTAPLAALLNAAVANARGDRSVAIASLRSALELAERADMPMYAEAGRHQLGLLQGGDKGAELVQQARSAMSAQEIRAPERFAAMLVPGNWGG